MTSSLDMSLIDTPDTTTSIQEAKGHNTNIVTHFYSIKLMAPTDVVPIPPALSSWYSASEKYFLITLYVI
jgi:hypothetical protein